MAHRRYVGAEHLTSGKKQEKKSDAHIRRNLASMRTLAAISSKNHPNFGGIIERKKRSRQATERSSWKHTRAIIFHLRKRKHDTNYKKEKDCRGQQIWYPLDRCAKFLAWHDLQKKPGNGLILRRRNARVKGSRSAS